jgi:hypothetical protein
LNIQAVNGYFNAKKVHYCKSEIVNVIELANRNNEDWIKEDIQERENLIISDLIEHFKENLG